jgi:CNT family concentrative nucleoside transporter
MNVAAMLIAFIALVFMFDWTLGLLPVRFCEAGASFGYAAGCDPLTLSQILGWLFSPLAWSMGVPWSEAATVGTLLGEKMVLTELYAYQHLSEILSDPNALSQRSAIIASYALCGFANFASIGVQIGGIGAIAPSRIKDLGSIGLRAMLGGTLAAMMTGTIAGVLL